MWYRWLFLILLVFSTQVFSAGRWDDESLDQAAQEAKTAISQLLAGDSQSKLIKQIYSADTRQKIIELAQIAPGAVRDFDHINNKVEVLNEIIGKIYSANKIGYNALRTKYVAQQYEKLAFLLLYEDVLAYDDDSAPYVFEKIAQIDTTGDDDLSKRKQNIKRQYGFRVKDTKVRGVQDKPKVCVKFSKMVRREPVQPWRDYLHVEPKIAADEWQYRGDKLCFTAAWQTRYSIHIDDKLESANRLALLPPFEHSVNSGTRDPMIRFGVTGKTLNAGEDAAIAIQTANVDRVKLQLWRVPGNNLSSEQIKELIESPDSLSSWRLQEINEKNAVPVYQGYFDVEDKVLNKTMTSNVFFADMVDKPRPGVYVLSAGSADQDSSDWDYELSVMSFSVTNYGISAYLTDEGLWSEIRDLKTAQPVANVTAKLYAKNNRVLGEVATNRQGIAHFPKPMINGKASDKPGHIIVQDEHNLAYLNIANNGFDLSDKGLSGTLANNTMMNWLWLDRGIYRPNDTLNAMWLLRTPDGKAFNKAPVWVSLIRPDGRLFNQHSVAAGASGAYQFSHDFGLTAPQGQWTLRLSLGKDGSGLITQRAVPVDAIVPRQVSVALRSEMPPKKGQTVDYDLQADWLYGAPADQLTARAVWKIKSGHLAEKRWQDWQIGLYNEQVFDDRDSKDLPLTDQSGGSQFSLTLDKLPFSTQPLVLWVKGSVTEPSGQQTSATDEQIIQRDAPYVALQQDNRQVNVALLNQQGQLQSGSLHWKLSRAHIDYYWYHSNGTWQYQRNETLEKVKEGDIAVTSASPSVLDLPLNDDGYWVVEVLGQQPEAASSLQLYRDRWQALDSVAPNQIAISSDKARYADGETVKLQFDVPFDGPASIKLADKDIIKTFLAESKQGKIKLDIEWDKAWDNGIWVLANAWNVDSDKARNRRAIGLHWLGGDLSPYSFDIAMELPEVALPDQALTVKLNIPKDEIKETTWVNVAIIDDGLYQLAKASFSNPLQAFFGKKQLNISFFDVWGSIIRQLKARRAALRSGAGDYEADELSAMQALPELDMDLVTFWSGPVQFDSDGQALVDMNVPWFNGRLRVMAGVWNTKRLGSAEQTVNVRAPVVATLYAPPYLSPNDQSLLRLRLHNTTDKPLQIAVSLFADDKVRFYKRDSKQTVTLAANEQKWIVREFSTNNVSGRVTFHAAVSGGLSKTLEQFADIRPLTLPQKFHSLQQLAGGEQLQTGSRFDGMVLGGKLLLSTQIPFDPSVIMEQLGVYPYGCSEQITSKAWNNLMLKALIERYDLKSEQWGSGEDVEKRLLNAQLKLANRQSYSGGFSLWGQGDEELWLTAYIAEFLLDVKGSNQLSYESVLNSALAYLRSHIMTVGGSGGQPDAAVSYAHYVLAKAGMQTQGALQRYVETINTHPVRNPALLHLMSALVMQGNVEMAVDLLDRSSETIQFKGYLFYGSALRDSAQSLVLIHKIERQLQQIKVNDSGLVNQLKQLTSDFWQQLTEQLAQTDYYSTQEMHWLSALAAQLPKTTTNTSVRIDGKAVDIVGQKRLSLGKNEPLPDVINDGQTPLYADLTQWYIPAYQQAVENGYKMRVDYEDLAGNPVDVGNLKLNQQVLVHFVIERDESVAGKSADVMLVYSLPAGLVAVASEQGKLPGLDERSWYNKILSPAYSESRDDRHLAAFNVPRDETSWHYVFMVRAARTGRWHSPGYAVEDMYVPNERASYPMAPVVIRNR